METERALGENQTNIDHLNCIECFRMDLKEVYQANRSSTCPGLALVPKLKFEHINLTNFSKTHVDLTVQIQSCTNPITV